ncbi:MAG: tetratricopeptide repeat protein [Bacteroidetes bacterium]|nr:tetratricopeptide repeat protein [Bacteroidota bacterium]MBS1539345.1 tetratricopeptide repeat protein [Bacteroidota bacterium]
MQRFFLFVILLGFAQSKIAAQSKRIDNIRQKAESASGVNRVDLLNELAVEVSSYDYARSIKIATEAFDLAKKLNYADGMALALLHLGVMERTIGNDTASIERLKQSITWSKQSKDRQLTGRVLTQMGTTFQSTDQLDSAEAYYTRAYQILKDSTNPYSLSFLYLSIAKLQELKNNPERQLHYLNRCWEIRKLLDDKRWLIYVGKDMAVFYTERGNYSKSLSILNEIQSTLGKDTVNNDEISLIHKERAIIYADQGNYKAALLLFAKAKNFYEQNVSQLELVNLYTDMGDVLSQTMGNYETSLKYFFKAIRIAEAQRFSREAIHLYAQVAWVYYLMEQDELAEKFSLNTLKLAENKHPYEESTALNILGLIATRKGINDQALNYLFKALAIREKYSFLAPVASTLLNIGIVYEQMGNYAKAEEYDLRSLHLDEKLNKAVDLNYTYQSLGQLYTKMRSFDKAHFYLNKAEHMAKEIKAMDILRDVYRNQRDLFEAQANYIQALRYSHLYENIRDSLFNENLGNRMASLQYDFELDQRNNEIKILTQQQQLQQSKISLQQAEIRQQRIMIIVGIVILSLISLVSYIVFRFYRKVKQLNIAISEQNEEIMVQSEELMEANETLHKLNREISEQKEEIQAQSEELIENNRAIAIINESLEEKIKERTAELKAAYTELDTFFYRSSHDFRRPLTTFMGLNEVAKIMVKDKAALELFEKVNETARNLDKMVNKLQTVNLASNEELVKTEINFKTLLETIRSDFNEELMRKKINLTLAVSLQEPFVSYVPLIKVIVRYLLENAISFSRPSNPEIRLQVAGDSNAIQLIIHDNGQGIHAIYLPRVWEMYFRANEQSTGNGLGLYIVKKIVDKLKGLVDIQSEVEKGTTVTITLPGNVEL